MRLSTLLFLATACATSAARAQTPASRLYGSSQAFYNTSASSWKFDDTTRYFFSGSRGHGGVEDFAYDADSLHFYTETAGVVALSRRWLQTLDAAGNVTSAYQYGLNSGGEWVPIRRYIYTYYADNSLQSEVNDEYDNMAGAFEPYGKKVYTYVSGKLTERLSQTWDAPSSAFVNYNRRTYTYDAAGLLTADEYDSWTSGAWTPGSRKLYTNNAAGVPTTVMHEWWEIPTASWNAWNRELFTYDASNRATERIWQAWDDVAAAFRNNIRTTQIYTGTNLTEKTSAYWDGTVSSGSWVPTTKYTYEHDGAGNETRYTLYNWDETASVWDPNSQTRKAYNSYNQLTESVSLQWSVSLNDFELQSGSSRQRNTYETYTGLHRANAEDRPAFQVYPVPASTVLNVVAEEGSSTKIATAIVVLFSADGRLLRQQPLQGARAVLNVDGLPAGTYMLQLRAETNTQSQAVTIAAPRY